MSNTENFVVLLPLDWTAIGVIINFFLLISIILAIASLRETQKARTVELLTWAMEQMSEIKPDIRVLQQSSDNYEEWDDEQLASAQKVSHTFQRLSYFVRAKLIDKKHFQAMWGLQLVDLWAKLEPWVISLRLQSGEPKHARSGAQLRKDFELIAISFSNYAKKARFPSSSGDETSEERANRSIIVD